MKQSKTTRELARNEESPVIIPAHEVVQAEGTITLNLEMPGLTRDEVEITVENQQLIVSGVRTAPAVEGKYLVRERRFGRYRRVFNLDETINTDAVAATMRNGVLTINLPVKEAAKPRRIQVKVR